MIARLWWKDARLFQSIWLFLALVGGLTQWLVVRYDFEDARVGWLVVSALGWTCLYGFAVSSAAFAGERESRTLTFLDTLPVDRGTLWGGKASFALVSTAVLAVILFGLAWPWTDHPGNVPPMGVVLGLGAILVEVIGWGLLWSSVSGSALGAAALAVCCVGVVSSMLLLDFSWSPQGLANSAPLRLVIASLTALVSLAVFTATPPRWEGLRRRRRSAPVLVRFNSKQTRPIVVYPGWASAMRRLAWQTRREAQPIVWKLVGLGFVLPAPFLPSGGGGLEFALWLNVLVGLWAGVSVFGTEGRTRGTRFLTHHGARPGLVWFARVAVWSSVLALIWGALLFLIVWSGVNGMNSREPGTYPLLLLSLAVYGFPFGMLAGMVIPRAITAFVVALAAMLAVVGPQAALVGWGMLSPWALLLTPLVVLAASWAWSGDWLYERPGAGRWVRLGLLIALPMVLLASTYASFRAYEWPDVDRPVEVSAALSGMNALPSHPLTNAAELYREADRLLRRNAQNLDERAHDNDKALERLRKASRLPACEFGRVDQMTVFSQPDIPDPNLLVSLLVESARRRQTQGDLPGAWDDLVSLFRMASHFSGRVPLVEAKAGMEIERIALDQARLWAVHAGQTPERLHAAIDEYQTLRIPFASARETAAISALLAERTLELPADTLATNIVQKLYNPGQRMMPWVALLVRAETTPWEVVRTRRAIHLLASASMTDAGLEPLRRTRLDSALRYVSKFPVLQGGTRETIPYSVLHRVVETTPLANFVTLDLNPFLDKFDRNEVARRALVQVMAVRSWQARHDGRSPETLAQLVPSELPELPTDPYSGKPFRYVRTQIQNAPLAGELPGEYVPPLVKGGSWVIYSVGPNRVDEYEQSGGNNQALDESRDVLFVIPPGPNDPPPPKPPADPEGQAVMGAGFDGVELVVPPTWQPQ